MPLLAVGAAFPPATLIDIDNKTIEFPAVFGDKPATVVFFYRGQW